MAASILSAAQQKTTYSSDASVLLSSAAQTSVEAQQLLATEKELAASRSVAVIAVQDLRLTESPDRLLTGLSVSVPVSTQLLTFRYSAPDPAQAERLAQSFADAYLKYQSRLLDGLVASYRSLDQLADSLRSRLVVVQAAVASARDNAQKSAAMALVDSLTSQISLLQQQRTTLLTSALISSTIAERAAPASKNAPPLKRGAAVGLIAGLVLGAFVAFACEYALRGRRKRRGVDAGRRVVEQR